MFWRLFLAHLIADFLLQSKQIAISKDRFAPNLFHCLMLFFVSLLLFVDLLSVQAVLMLLSISFLHGILDFLKTHFDRALGDGRNWILFLADQMVHLLLIVVALQIFFPVVGFNIISNILAGTNHQNLFMLSAFFILITLGGSYFTASVCKKFANYQAGNDSLQSAGKYIGIFERIIVAASILSGRYELIGFLIAAKSIIRHNEKNDRAFTEYFLIGTFSSFIWAGAFTFLYLAIR